MAKVNKGPVVVNDPSKPATKPDSRVVASNTIPTITVPDYEAMNSYEDIEDALQQKEDIIELGQSVFACKHIVSELGVDKVKTIFRKNGYDLDNPITEETQEERKDRKRKQKQRLKAWEACPNSINPAKGIYIDPNCPNMGRTPGFSPQLGSTMWKSAVSPISPSPGSIGVSKNQVHPSFETTQPNVQHYCSQMAFHLSPLGVTPGSPAGFFADQGVKLKLGQSSDGTQCITITYDQPPGVSVPPPCATERETQFLESDYAVDKKAGKKAGKEGKSKDNKKGNKGKKK